MKIFLDLANVNTKTQKPCKVFELLKKHKTCKVVWLATYSLSESVVEKLNLASKYYLIRVITAKLPAGIQLKDLKFYCQITLWNHTKIWGFDQHVYAGSANLSDDTSLNLMFKLNKKQAAAAADWYQSLDSFSLREVKTTIIS